ncbi:MAG: anhydro-N-acetylmuramic acid kinase, partial [Nitrospinota bacterium]
SIDLIGSHGQTISHIPRAIKGKHGKDVRFGYRTPATLQIAEAAVIAKKTGVHTVSDFRTRDIAEGGEGAPLTPYAHYHLFSNKRRSVSVNNLGGISNLTYLRKGGTLEDIIAFDTGPGNMLIDGIMFLLTEGKKNYDLNGSMARKGKPDEFFIRRMMQNPYLRKPPPKSTGREEFGLEFARTILNQARMKYIAPADLVASVTYFTARTIGLAYRKFILDKENDVDEAIFCGGGINNKTLMSMIRDVLDPIKVTLTDEYKIPGESLESIAFALLAHATVTGTPASIPAATGAKGSVVLGKVSPGCPGVKFQLS